MDQRDDATIIEAVLNGNAEEYRCIVDRYQGRVYACAYSITGNAADAKDVVQEVFIRFFKHMKQFDSRRPLQPYLLSIALNTARSLLRKKGTRMVEINQEETDMLQMFTDHADTPFDSLDRVDRIKQTRKLVEELPLVLREVCSLFYLSEHSCSEVANILNISENSVKVALHRARKRLLHGFLAQERMSS